MHTHAPATVEDRTRLVGMIIAEIGMVIGIIVFLIFSYRVLFMP